MALFGSGTRTSKHYDSELRALAEELGLKFQRAHKSRGPMLGGRIGGRKLRVETSNVGSGRITVRFESGLTRMNGFSVRPRSLDVRTNKSEIVTGDYAFDSRFRILANADVIEAAEVLNYLTPQRREIAYALDDAFVEIRIKDDKLEAQMAKEPPVDALRGAIDLCLLAASAFEPNEGH